jgi:hypothetical protein
MVEGVCIYCKQLGVLTREHVLPRALGGSTTDSIVCAGCQFSYLDQALAERSLVAMERVARTPVGGFRVRVGGDNLIYDPGLDLHLEMELQNGMIPALHPQMHWRGDGAGHRYTLVLPDDRGRAELLAFIDTRFRKGTLLSIHVKVGAGEPGLTPRLVAHRSHDGFIRASSRADAAAMLRRIESDWGAGLREVAEKAAVTTGSIDRPRPLISLTVCVDDEYRAIAKIAFNVLAMDFGREFVLRGEFDPIRNYIAGKDIRHPTLLAPDEVAVDHRFVERETRNGEPFLGSHGHTVIIENLGDSLIALVTLYGRDGYCVHLGPVASPKLGPWCREFSIDRTGSKVIEAVEMYRRRTGRSKL